MKDSEVVYELREALWVLGYRNQEQWDRLTSIIRKLEKLEKQEEDTKVNTVPYVIKIKVDDSELQRFKAVLESLYCGLSQDIKYKE